MSYLFTYLYSILLHTSVSVLSISLPLSVSVSVSAFLGIFFYPKKGLAILAFLFSHCLDFPKNFATGMGRVALSFAVVERKTKSGITHALMGNPSSFGVITLFLDNQPK